MFNNFPSTTGVLRRLICSYAPKLAYDAPPEPVVGWGTPSFYSPTLPLAFRSGSLWPFASYRPPYKFLATRLHTTPLRSPRSKNSGYATGCEESHHSFSHPSMARSLGEHFLPLLPSPHFI